MKPGMTAADLGAAPGGWTWVLTWTPPARHQRRIPLLREHVLATGLVEHLRADGFHWKLTLSCGRTWLNMMVGYEREAASKVGIMACRTRLSGTRCVLLLIVMLLI